MQERNYVINLEETQARRILQENLKRNLAVGSDQEITVLLNLQMKTIPESIIYPSPFDMTKIFTTKGSEMKSRFEFFDTTYKIPYSESIRYQPAFVDKPIVLDTQSYSVF